MKIAVRTGDVYIPEWNGNREADEPIRVHYRYLCKDERDRFIGVEPIKFKKDGEPELTVRDDGAGMAKLMIKRIEGLTIEENGKDRVIDDAVKLYSSQGIPVALIQEIEGALKAASAVIEQAPLK